jgi:hypothetical protein
MTPEELEEYRQEYNFIVDPNGRLAVPELYKTYFFDDNTNNIKYIGKVTEKPPGRNTGITVQVINYVPGYNGNNQIIYTLTDLDMVDAYLIPDDENASEATTVTYGSDTEDDINTDELDDQFSRITLITLGKRDRSNNFEPNKRSRQRGGKKSKKRKSRKVKRRKTRKVKRRKH